MAAKSILVQSAMVMKYKVGVDGKGKDIVKSERFSKIKLTSKNEEILAVAEALKSLMKYPVVQTIREDEQRIINE